jgi:hypothetical protein
MAQYMLLIRGGDPDGEISPEQMQGIIQQYVSWAESLRSAGKLVASDKLQDGGRVVTVRDGQIVDGPFTETKEAVGGYFTVKADSYEEAVTMARECPVFEHGGKVEVRQLETS